MKITQRAVVLAAVAAALIAPFVTAAGAAAGPGDHPSATFVNWPAYLNGPAHSSLNSAATAITPPRRPR